jgi:phosphatidylglycerophosphate synthase
MSETVRDRRPLKSRSTGWARSLSAALVRAGAAADHVSLAGIFFAVAGAALLVLVPHPAALFGAAACVQLRLLCNLLDGMVAVEGGRKSALGVLYNEIPDRIEDSALIVALGYAAGVPVVGWYAALVAAITAYLRLLGGTLGLPQDFRGPMAKPHRMAVLTAGCLVGAVEMAAFGTLRALEAAAWVIAVGATLTCGTRTRALARALSGR